MCPVFQTISSKWSISNLEISLKLKIKTILLLLNHFDENHFERSFIKQSIFSSTVLSKSFVFYHKTRESSSALVYFM
jgi:hypothetical protein